MTFHFTVVLTGGSSAGSCNHIGTIQPDTLVSLGLEDTLLVLLTFISQILYQKMTISRVDDLVP